MFLSFQAILGNKYGYRPIPTYIPDQLFTVLQKTSESDAAWEIVSKWYERDENAEPPLYVLQSVSNMIPDVTSSVSRFLIALYSYQIPNVFVGNLFIFHCRRRRRHRHHHCHCRHHHHQQRELYIFCRRPHRSHRRQVSHLGHTYNWLQNTVMHTCFIF